MVAEWESIPLIHYLEGREPYYGKIFEIRELVTGWLNYIPQSFPHYTRHTIQHSDEIVDQISKILFSDDDPNTPVVPITSVEAYILVVSAMLHDAGMVISDAEKQSTLASDEWNRWISQGPAAGLWADIDALERGDVPVDQAERRFLADVHRRYVIAEFFRRRHHARSAELVLAQHVALGRLDFGNLILRRAIANTCLAHGLSPHELEDKERYPDRGNIMGESCNLRFLALLLRLGDLLDIGSDRACPLLLNAASPLPSGSQAHWTQYEAITHRLTAPDVIEIRAECQNPDEHRVLQDWCQWIVNEVAHARGLMMRSQRFAGWQPPVATIEGTDPTISIQPRADANYSPVEWKFELDHDLAFKRLINDVYDSPLAFIRELIQNALDATRCRLYSDLADMGMEVPRYPTEAAAALRDSYPITITVSNEERVNELSGGPETRQIFTIDDSGIGMDSEIIQRYFLQVGRSYYASDQFRRRFPFTPLSRFGIGFLSVFVVSDDVMVETFSASQAALNPEALLLSLHGPRNYILLATGARRTPGTTITVVLREPLPKHEVTRYVLWLCRSVEFPIILREEDTSIEIQPETPESFLTEVPDLANPGCSLLTRTFAISADGISGNVYVVAYVGDGPEDWGRWSWATSVYPSLHPQAKAPTLPRNSVCVHGLTFMESREELGAKHNYSHRVDYRRSADLTISRGPRAHQPEDQFPGLASAVEQTVIMALEQHLAESDRGEGPDGWRYKQRLITDFPLSTDYWRQMPGTILIQKPDGQTALGSLIEIQEIPVLTTSCNLAPLGSRARKVQDPPHYSPAVPFLAPSVLDLISEDHLRQIFAHRHPRMVRPIDEDHWSIDWSEGESVANQLFSRIFGRPVSFVSLPIERAIGVAIHRTSAGVYEHALLNSDHPLIKWLVHVEEESRPGRRLDRDQFRRAVALLQDPIWFSGYRVERAQKFLELWRSLTNIDEDLKPPECDLTKAFEARQFSSRDLPLVSEE